MTDVAKRLQQLDRDGAEFSDRQYQVKTLRTLACSDLVAGLVAGNIHGSLLREMDFALAKDSSRFRNTISTNSPGWDGIDVVEALEYALVDKSPMRKFGTVVRRDKILHHSLPTLDDTSQEAVIIGENGISPGLSDVTDFGARSLKGSTFCSRIVKISRALLEDAPQLAAAVFTILGNRLSRGMNRKFTLGLGGSEPMGVVNSARVAVTSASTTAFTIDDLLALVAAVPSEYRERGRFMMHSDIWLVIKRMKDGAGRNLWKAAGLDEWPISINAHMTNTIAAGAKPILFGDFSRYAIVDIGPARNQALTESFAQNIEVGFQSTMVSDGALVDAGSGPIQALQLALA